MDYAVHARGPRPRGRYSTPPRLPPPPLPRFISRVKFVARWSGFAVLSSAFGILLIGAGIFVHDALTYSEKHIDRVPLHPLALHPLLGGPKNLPVVSAQVDDQQDDEMRNLADKPKLLIIGGGWAAIGLLETLYSGDYHVTVVCPETYSTFTPLLPSAAVGTVQFRSLIEPLRKILARLHGHFIHGKAVDIVMSDRLLEVETISAPGTPERIYVPYDKLVIACGSVSSTHGVQGLENCFQLKTIADAQAIRRRVLDNFETASLPTTTPEERRRLLSFVVCGGGPTGVETAAEIFDLCQEDIMQYFPKICRKEVSIHIIQSRSHILNTYSEGISKYAEAKFLRDGVDLITSARVESVTPTHVTYTQRDEKGEGKVTKYTVPTNMVLWSTGISMNPFTKRVSSLLPNQVHRKAIETDSMLRVKGAPVGSVYALGDCATIETAVVPYLLELVQFADKNHDGKIDFEEWEIMVQQIKKRIPMTGVHLQKVRALFEAYDADSNQSLDLNELCVLLTDLGNKITALPATAQVASQQGKYLGRKLSKLARVQRTTGAAADDEAVAKPFRYRHLGSLAYIGNAAVFDMGGTSFMGGLAAMYAWRSIYWSEQVSARTRALLMIDWIIRGIWGRDLSRL